MNRAALLILALAIPLLGGCLTMEPTYERPEAPVPTNWPSGSAYLEGASEDGVPIASSLQWQEFFTDPGLRQVVVMALEKNRDLRLAALNVEKARAMYGVQRAQLFPAINATGAGNKQRSSADLTRPEEPRTTESYSVDLGVASWEIDLFGRIRSLKAQALEEYLATEEARRGAQIALVAEVTSAYLALAADRENLDLARSTLKSQKEAYGLIRRQYEVDLVTEIDLRRAQSQVDVARVDVARFTRRVAQDRNALNLLAGAPVPEELLAANLAGIGPTREIAAGLSSEVLLARPDIMAAEHQLRSANAFIGAARAAFFPRIGLTAAVGTASDQLNNLFSGGTDTWSFSPQIVMPIFDSRVWAAHRVSKATQKIALVRYERTIQEAFREVADVLAACGTLDEQASAQRSVVDAAEKIYHLADKRYANGIDSYLSVLDAQRSLYGAQQALISLELARLANQVRLYAVLGGGGEPLEADEEAPQE